MTVALTRSSDTLQTQARAYTHQIRRWRDNVRKKLTITVDEEVYEGPHRVVGRRRISRFLSALARPHVVQDDLEAGYRAMAPTRSVNARRPNGSRA